METTKTEAIITPSVESPGPRRPTPMPESMAEAVRNRPRPPTPEEHHEAGVQALRNSLSGARAMLISAQDWAKVVSTLDDAEVIEGIKAALAAVTKVMQFQWLKEDDPAI